MKDNDEFRKKIKEASELALSGKLVTFGVTPSHPEVGYGYIKHGNPIFNNSESENVAFTIDSFVEKPNLKKATQYFNSGEYLWNSGMFLFKASVFLNELKIHAPKIYLSCEEAFTAKEKDLDFIRINPFLFETCPDISVDYAVMEKTQKGAVVKLDVGWSDVGSFSSLWEVAHKDKDHNVMNGDVISHQSEGCYIHSSNRLVATVGIEDLVVVETKDAVLVASKDKVQNVKEIVNVLKSKARYEYKHQREVYRPWGKYDSLDFGERDQVKRITVNPGAKLSIQMHHHRAEHWVVVSGTAKVTNGEKNFLVTENESTYIPVGQIHALENPGVLPLELIEVQTGSYLGEDDIVRLKDNYGRI